MQWTVWGETFVFVSFQMLSRNINACLRELNFLYFVATTCRYNLLCAYLHLEDTSTRYTGLWRENTEEIAAFMCYISKASSETFRSCDGFLLTYSLGSLPSAAQKKKNDWCDVDQQFFRKCHKKTKRQKKKGMDCICNSLPVGNFLFVFALLEPLCFSILKNDCLTCFCVCL